jgi:hypothetical protein
MTWTPSVAGCSGITATGNNAIERPIENGAIEGNGAIRAMARDRERSARRGAAANGAPRGIGKLRGVADIPRDVGIHLSDYPRLLGAISKVVDAGDAVIVGSTRDGGAVCITVLSGDDREKLYASSEEELGRICEALLDAYGDAE